ALGCRAARLPRLPGEVRGRRPALHRLRLPRQAGARNLDSRDLVQAFWHFHRSPRPGEIYNMGGARRSHCSILEAAGLVAELCGRRLRLEPSEDVRLGDHIWWISDVRRFEAHDPGWRPRYALREMLAEMVEAARERFRAQVS